MEWGSSDRTGENDVGPSHPVLKRAATLRPCDRKGLHAEEEGEGVLTPGGRVGEVCGRCVRPVKQLGDAEMRSKQRNNQHALLRGCIEKIKNI